MAKRAAKPTAASGKKSAKGSGPKDIPFEAAIAAVFGQFVSADDILALAGSLKAIDALPDDPALDEAQEIIFEAWEEPDPAQQVRLARKALATSPDCADGYTILASAEPPGSDAQIALLQQAVEAGRRAIGNEFESLAGEFWSLIPTRPYMRARAGLASALLAKGDHSAAAADMSALLDLDPGDHQGVRYGLSMILFRLGRDAEFDALMKRFRNDESAAWTYAAALRRYRAKGATATASRALAKALDSNAHVPAYLLGKRKIPTALPDLIGFGDKEEAIAYAAMAKSDWKSVPGALDWLRNAAGVDPAKPRRTQVKPA